MVVLIPDIQYHF